jgi:hypothetical protein
MSDFVIEMHDPALHRRETIFLSDRELLEIRRQAGAHPLTPCIVRRLEEKAAERGCRLAASRGELFRIARDILVRRERMFAVSVRSLEEKVCDPAPQPDDPTPTRGKPESSAPLLLAWYANPLDELDELVEAVRERGYIPVLWSTSRGILPHGLSQSHPLLEDVDSYGLSDPRELLRFILQRPQPRISYILEDFHHFIGNEGAVHPSFGEIRSLLKELYRALRERDERIYLFVPSSYLPPLDLDPFLQKASPPAGRPLGYLEKYGRLLTDTAALARSKPVVGMDRLIERVTQVLCQMEVNNPLLVGHPGVGKTAVVEGLAAAMARNRVPPALEGRALYALSLNTLVAGTRYRGDFEERIEGLMQDVRGKEGRIIVFIDEIHTLLDAGAARGSMGAGEILKTSLARGEFPCVGATTYAGAEILAEDPALARRFRRIEVQEPSPAEALVVLEGVAPAFEAHHRVEIDSRALKAAVDLSVKHLMGEFLPGKAIALLDAACAYCRMKGQERVGELDIRMELKRNTHS